MKTQTRLVPALFLSLVSMIFSASHIHADSFSDETTQYESALSALLEETIIGNTELVEVIENSKKGLLINPIAEGKARVSSNHGIYSDAIESLLKEDRASIDLPRVIEWAEEQLIKRGYGQKQREEAEKDAKQILKFHPPRLVATKDRTCFIKEDKTITCWGSGTHAEYLREYLREDLRVQQISLGVSHTCVMNLDGTVACRGSSANGRSTPPADLGRVLQISGSDTYTCALKVDGKVACWGNKANGKCTPPPDLGSVVKISAGRNHVCAIRENDETVLCWGSDARGQSTPPENLGAVSDISAGDVHTCAIKKENRRIVCWGNTVTKLSTMPGLTRPARQISTGDYHACATTHENGSTVCWAIYWGRWAEATRFVGIAALPIGAGFFLASVFEAQPLIESAKSIAWVASEILTFLWAFQVTLSVLQNEFRVYGPYDSPGDIGSVLEISAGPDHVCAIKEDQTIVCWGDNSYGQSTPPEGRIP